MKIAHLCLSNFYYDGFSYQENLLVSQNVNDGHDVIVIASTESIDENGDIKFLDCGKYLGNDGANVIRISYSRLIPKNLQHKFRSYKGLLKELNKFKPDIIYFHGLSAYELLSLKEYKEKNHGVKIILDCHSDKYNSAVGFLSRNILHNFFYKRFFIKTVPFVDKVFCISLEAMDFAIDFYRTPKEKVEFFPLGGNCLEDEKYFQLRNKVRAELDINKDKIMILQTGKMNAKKRIVESIIQFKKVSNDNFVYIIAGSLEEDVKSEVLELVSSDERIRYLGWVNSVELKGLLCASDVYLQPGSQSATMQQSICLRNPVILDNVRSHKPFVEGNGWLIDSFDDMSKIFENISASPFILNEMSERSYQIAKEKLDYKMLAKKIYEVAI